MLLFKVGADEGLATANFSALSFLAGSIVSHSACAIVGVVGVIAVRAGDGVVTDGESLLSVLLVDVRFFTFLAGFVVFVFFVGASASVASDRAVGVDLVTEFPATWALGESDFFNPLGAHAGGVEEEERVTSEGFEVGFIWVRDAEADVSFGAGWDAISVGPVWSFKEGSLFE